jgi:hypothetical protein
MLLSVSFYLGRPTYLLTVLVLVLLLTILCITFLAYLHNRVNVTAAACFTGSVPPPTSVAATTDGDRRPRELSILVGVHTMAKKHSPAPHPHGICAVADAGAPGRRAGGLVRFTLCTRPIAPEHRPYMALDSQAYDNVLLFII